MADAAQAARVQAIDPDLVAAYDGPGPTAEFITGDA